MQDQEDSYEKVLERFTTQRRALQQNLQEVLSYGRAIVSHSSERVSSGIARQIPPIRGWSF